MARARSTARKRAVNTLYEADEKGQRIDSLLAERIEYPGADTPLPPYAIEICRGVDEHYRVINRALNTYTTNRSVGRMAVVDRNILRMGVWEIVFNDDVPDKVAIAEAAHLAETLSGENAPSFVTGVLAAISDHKADILQDEAQLQADWEARNGATREDYDAAFDADEFDEPAGQLPAPHTVGNVAPASAKAASGSDWEEWNADYGDIEIPSATEPDPDGDGGKPADAADGESGEDAPAEADGTAADTPAGTSDDSPAETTDEAVGDSDDSPTPQTDTPQG